MHTPEVARAYLGFATALRNLPGLNDKQREIATLVVSTREQASYLMYGHGRSAVYTGVLTQNEVNELLVGRCPASFTRPEALAYAVSTAVCTTPGPLAEKGWDSAVESLGRDGALALVHYIGFLRYATTILNGFDARLPAESERSSPG